MDAVNWSVVSEWLSPSLDSVFCPDQVGESEIVSRAFWTFPCAAQASPRARKLVDHGVC